MSEKSLIDVYLTSVNEAWRKATNNPKEKGKAETNSTQDIESENKETFASVISNEKTKLTEADTGNISKEDSENNSSDLNQNKENFNVATEDTDYSQTDEKYIDGAAVMAEKRLKAEEEKAALKEDPPLRHVALPDGEEEKQRYELNALSTTQSDVVQQQIQTNKENLEKKWDAISKKINGSDYAILENRSDALMKAIKMDSNVLIGKEA